MQKPSRSCFLLIFSFFLAGITVLSESCRKTDHLASSPTLTETEAKFFNNYGSADVREKGLVDFFKRRNDSSQFVEKTVERIGYPRWDKAISGKESRPAGRQGNDEAIITYIPFVRENENHVNASLVVRTAPGDTSFHYLCDWQYSKYGYDTTATGWNAQTVFALFTLLDNHTLGHTKFKITDDSLFAGQSVTATLLPAAPGNAAGRLEPSIQCTFYEMVTCIEHTGRNTAVEVMFNPCYTWYKSFCTTIWVYVPDGPPVGGGGGNPPGDEPPTCHGGPVEAAKPMDPCGPGWEPIPVDDPPLQEEPVDSMLNRYARKINKIADSIFTLSQANNVEWGCIIVKNTLGEIYAKNCTTSNNSEYVKQNRILETGETIVAELHTHPDSSSNPLNRSAVSGVDFDALRINSKDRYTCFVDFGNIRYAIVIEDVNKSRNFFAENRPTNLYQLQYAAAYGAVNWQNATEIAITGLVPFTNSGIGIYKSNTSKTSFTKIN